MYLAWEWGYLRVEKGGLPTILYFFLTSQIYQIHRKMLEKGIITSRSVLHQRQIQLVVPAIHLSIRSIKTN